MFDATAHTETNHPSALWHPTGATAAPQPIGDPPEPKQRQREALADEITTLAGHLNAAHYRFLKLLDEFDRREGWAGPGIRSLAHWLNWKCGLGQLVAREKVRVARALRALPLTDAAFERGEISYSKVRAMTRAATPENEADLLNIARHGTAAHVERLVSAYRRSRASVDTTPGEREVRREERFHCYAEDDETMIFGGRVSVEQGRLLMKALDAMVAEIEADGDAAVDPESNVSAETNVPDSMDASADRIHDTAADGLDVSAETGDSDSAGAGAGADSVPNAAADVSAETLSSGEPDSVPPERPRARRAAALARIAEHYLATRGAGSKSLAASEAYQVFVHVNANDAHPDNRINGAHTCYTDDRRCLAPHVARQLACDASRRTVLENERGEVLNIGRRSRTVPRRIAHALRIRDGGCRFPGCGHRRWTDAHHIRHWADGGETSLDNLVTLCRYHHRSLHRDEYQIERGADGGLIFTVARGERIPATVHPQFADGENASGRVQRLRSEHQERGVEIDETTAVTRWQGESMDYSTAIDWLLRRDGVMI